MLNTYCFSTATVFTQTRRNVKLHVRNYLIRRICVDMVQLCPVLRLNIDYQLKS
jgi:hypothetical protein